MKPISGQVLISERSGTISTLLLAPKEATHLMVLGHGAGAGMHHSFMARLSEALSRVNIATLRYQFPYMENGKGRPDVPNVAHKTIERVIEDVQSKISLPIVLAGKSFGGRMSSQLIAKNPIDGVISLVFYGFPLHSPAKPGNERGEHLKAIKIPMLFLQGDRDALARLNLLTPLLDQLPLADLEILEGANHGFRFTKKSGVTEDASFELLASLTHSFLKKL